MYKKGAGLPDHFGLLGQFDLLFLYHNGAESYYASRAFRRCLKV